jgi:hypothetical protein
MLLKHKITGPVTADDEILSIALDLFKGLKGFYLQEVIEDANGTLGFGESYKFANQKDLSRMVWNMPGSKIFIAILNDSEFDRITYKGIAFTITYKNFSNNPVLDYYKSNTIPIKAAHHFESLEVETDKLRRQLKNIN